MNIAQLEKITLTSGAPAFGRVLARLRALKVVDIWDINSRSSLGSVNWLRDMLGLGKVQVVDEAVLTEMEEKLKGE